MIEINRLWAALRGMVSTAEVSRVDEDDNDHYNGQASFDYEAEKVPIEGVVISQPYGLSANPPIGSRGVFVRPANQADNPILINPSPVDGSRPKVAAGESRLWSVFENYVLLKNDSSVEIKTPDGSLIILKNDKSVEITGGGASIKFSAAEGITITPGAGQQLKLGGTGAALANARVGSTLTSGGPIAVWALTVETALNGLLPGLFTPANSFATTVAVPGGLGTVQTGSPNVQST